MLFDTVGYWLFFAAVVVLVAATKPAPAKALLLVASYVFYAFTDLRMVALLAGSTFANFLFGLAIDARTGRARRRAVVAAIVFNLGLLGVFKYFNFFVGSVAALTGHAPGIALQILLPVGISFYTFEGIAYAVDVYRRELPAVRNPLDFALFVAFFPHLVAGPIIRPTAFLPQVGQAFALSQADARWSLAQILKGLFKKLVLSNSLAPIADAYFDGVPFDAHAVPGWVGVLAFSLQIYFDFSGYTDIARGCARLLGFRFPSNFERPYLAADIADFWRRWHISLSTWLRDYLYVPLGGNRRGAGRTYVNLMIVMGLGGLWHGASWNFAIWGLYHGVLLAAHRAWRSVRDGATRRAGAPLPTALSTALTFALVTIGWIPFRARDLATSGRVLGDLWQAPDFGFVAGHPAIAAIAVTSAAWCVLDRDRRLQHWWVERASLPAAAVCAAAVCALMELFARVDTQIPFVYFQF